MCYSGRIKCKRKNKYRMWNWLPPADFQLQAHSSVHHMGIDLDAQAFFALTVPY